MTYEEIKSRYNTQGFKFYEGTYNVNNFGIRNADLTTVDKFNDIRGVAYQDAFGNKICLVWACTTKPGLSGLNGKPQNPDGTFILAPGYYPKCWTIGKHKGEYDALVQAGTGVFKGWRDSDADGNFDFSGKIWDNVQGLNDHTTRAHDIKFVGGFSLGCQVTQDDKEHQIKMAVCQRSAELYSNSFSYALFQN